MAFCEGSFKLAPNKRGRFRATLSKESKIFPSAVHWMHYSDEIEKIEGYFVMADSEEKSIE